MIVRIIWGAKVIKKNEWGGGEFSQLFGGKKHFSTLFC